MLERVHEGLELNVAPLVGIGEPSLGTLDEQLASDVHLPPPQVLGVQ